jgi:hypothetical protein
VPQVRRSRYSSRRSMPNLIRIAGRLPIPKARRLALQPGLIDRGFRRKIAKARKAKDSVAVDELQARRHQEALMMREEMDQEYSDRLDALILSAILCWVGVGDMLTRSVPRAMVAFAATT